MVFIAIQLMVEPSAGEPDVGYCRPATPGDSPPLHLLFEYLGLAS